MAAALTCRHYSPESNAESAALPDRDRQEIVPYRGLSAVNHGVAPTVAGTSRTVTAMAFLCQRRNAERWRNDSASTAASTFCTPLFATTATRPCQLGITGASCAITPCSCPI